MLQSAMHRVTMHKATRRNKRMTQKSEVIERCYEEMLKEDSASGVVAFFVCVQC